MLKTRKSYANEKKELFDLYVLSAPDAHLTYNFVENLSFVV